METTKTLWLPEKASTFADMVDSAFNLYYWISIFFFVAIVACIVLFVFKYLRRRPDQLASGQMIHHTALEVIWTGIPMLIVLCLFIIGMKGYWHMRVAPSNAMTINVVGRKWSWSFDYTQGINSDTLVVPVHQAIRLKMTSLDVLHSFSIPAFRTKADVIPGRYSSLWFEATRTGVFQVFCTQYCGTNHSYMWTAVKVLEKPDYEAWLADASDPSKGKTPVEFGAMVYTKRGCNACHSLDGTKGIGPSWKGSWGQTHTLADGNSVLVDETYLRQSMNDPASQVVAGFQPVMPPFKGVLKENEIVALVAFFQTLK